MLVNVNPGFVSSTGAVGSQWAGTLVDTMPNECPDKNGTTVMNVNAKK